MNPSAIVDDYLDRERRKSNFIVYKLEEPTVQSADERSKLDSQKLVHLCKSELHVGDFEIKKCIRLGKLSQSRARPMLIAVPSVNVRYTILKNATSLRKSENFKNDYISPDLTVKQREQAKQLKAELQILG